MKKIIMGVIGAALVACGVMIAPVSASGNSCPPGSPNASYTNSIAECSLSASDSTKTDLWGTVNTIINVVLGALGIITVIMIIIGGFTYLTSQGDPGKVKKGRDTLLYGIIGLIIALLAFAIVNFVLAGIFGSGSSSGGSTPPAGGTNVTGSIGMGGN